MLQLALFHNSIASNAQAFKKSHCWKLHISKQKSNSLAFQSPAPGKATVGICYVKDSKIGRARHTWPNYAYGYCQRMFELGRWLLATEWLLPCHQYKLLRRTPVQPFSNFCFMRQTQKCWSLRFTFLFILKPLNGRVAHLPPDFNSTKQWPRKQRHV